MFDLFAKPAKQKPIVCDIARGTADDIGAMVEIYQTAAARNDPKGFGLSPVNLEKRRERYEAMLRDNDADVFTAKKDGVLQGFLVAETDLGFLEDVYARQSGRGIGTQLMTAYMAHAIAQNAQQIVLVASTDQGVQFYARFGFEATGRGCRWKNPQAGIAP